MKFRIVESVTGENLAGQVPTRYRAIIPRHEIGEKFTIIVFRPQSDERVSGVIWSGLARQAIGRLGKAQQQGERVLALAADFTDEAFSVLDAHGIEPIRLTHFGWSDESWLNRRN